MRKLNFNLVLPFIQKRIFSPIPTTMKMKNQYYTLVAALATLFFASCGVLGKKDKNAGAMPTNGQLMGIAPGAKFIMKQPYGMVFIPQGTFHMGPSDEDPSYAFSARNRSVSISGFWMDATEITNNEYRQFAQWVRDSIAAKELGYIKNDKSGGEFVDWNKVKTIKWNDPTTLEKMSGLILPPEDRIFGKMELDPQKMVYVSEYFDLKEAAKRENATKPRSSFIMRDTTKI
jgi:formylglycine-generating enzyme required for sulfatase activity